MDDGVLRTGYAGLAGSNETGAMALSRRDRQAFHSHGYLVIRGLAASGRVQSLRALAEQHLSAAQPPLELEAALDYPGSPADQYSEGGDTIRRLLQAYDRDSAFRDWALEPAVTGVAAALLSGYPLKLTRSHHNCIMTKHPRHSSATLWHQDIRYWRFERNNLVTVWLAMGPERRDNGCLWVFPGSHRLEIARERYDEALFLRSDHPDNRRLIETAVPVGLEPGDVLFFHSGLIHAAGPNLTPERKLALVFTYHDSDNHPFPASRSTRWPEIVIESGDGTPRCDQ